MKYLFIALLLLLGISEIIAISTLHDRIGLAYSIYLYLGTTMLGGALLWFGWGTACENFKTGTKTCKKIYPSLKDGLLKSTDEESKEALLMFDSMLFFTAVVLISIPGVVTDALGILLSFKSLRTGTIYLFSYIK
ncbi:FxsA family protein [Pelagicoccus sp. NFK12]|uniref:FxsA family protein n=1 Tax=Pelagicoccus enzymogenes TaxID=2773457 RepID=A0A927IGZ0_9BACT|nr:FxsA family protein [Pelagicoccus enzymogenes]MBD5779656.1 FxsA family protein [Pelagicoccus enzymogenes]